MRASIICLVASILLAISAFAGENCKITDVRSLSFDAKAIGLSRQSGMVLVVIVTATTEQTAPILLKWKDSVPTIVTEDRKVQATLLLIPNWLPFEGGVGPFATRMQVGGQDIGGWAKIDDNIWGDWLAIERPGRTTGDHISVPIGSVTVTVKKEKPVLLKFLFPETPPLTNAVLSIPGCTPSPCPLSAPLEPKAHGAEVRPQSLPEEKVQRAGPTSPQPIPPAPLPPLSGPQRPDTPRSEVERLVVEAVTLYEKGEIGAAQEVLSKARQVAEKCTEESLRDWLVGEIAKGYAQIMDHAGASETTLAIRRGARYCRVAYEVVAILAQQDPEIAQAVYETVFPKINTVAYLRIPLSIRREIIDIEKVPENAMAQRAIEEARKAHAEGRLPVRPSRPKWQAPGPSVPAPPTPAPKSSAPRPSASSERPGRPEDGFVRLFNGEDLRGWRSIGQGRWDVEAGAIVGRLDQPTPASGFLIYDRKSFSDFILRLKFKIPTGNSGIMIRSTEGGWAGLVGLQIDLDAKDRSSTGSIFEVCADSISWGRKVGDGSLSYDIHRQVSSEWTEMTIRAEGASITVTVAGQQTAQWRDYPGAREGLIALQLWGRTEVVFKEIEICELSSAGQSSLIQEKVPPAPTESPREAIERLVRQAQEQYERGDEGAAQESLAQACQETEKISQQPVRDWVWKKIVVEGYAYIGHFGPIKELVYKIRDRDTRSRTGYEVALLQAWPHQQWNEAIRTAGDLILQGGWGVGPDTEEEQSRCREAIAKIKELRKAWEEGKLTPPVRQRGVAPQPKESKQPKPPSSPDTKQ